MDGNIYIALLRGINVSGHRMIKMAELQKSMEELQISGISTYIQSGNIVFRSSEKDPPRLAGQIAAKIMERFGFDVPVVIRSLEEMETLAAANPLIINAGRDPEKCHVTFLSDAPAEERAHGIDGSRFLPDEFVVQKKEVYLYCPDGYGRTKLTNPFFESKLKVTATTRNWKTVMTLLEMAKRK